MATPTIEEVLSGTNRPAGGTLLLTTAAGTAVGDVLVAIQHSDFYDVANLNPPTPGTWTEIVTADLGVDDHHQRAWWREVTSAGANGVTFAPINDEDLGAYVYRLSGTDTTTPVDDAAGSAGTPGSTSHVAPSVAPSTADALLICTWGTGNGAYTAVPGSMTQRGNVDGDPFFEMIAADEVLTGSGATGTRTATFNAAFPWVAITLAIQGAAAAGEVTGSGAATAVAGVATGAGSPVAAGAAASVGGPGAAAAAGQVVVSGVAAAVSPGAAVAGAGAALITGVGTAVAPAGVAAGVETLVVVVTPPERTLVVPAESRCLAVAAEPRTLSIPAEERIMHVV